MDNQCAYTDSNRAMAVCMGDKELSKALKNFEKVGEMFVHCWGQSLVM